MLDFLSFFVLKRNRPELSVPEWDWDGGVKEVSAVGMAF
jgi:hypothetical protein